jgi:hypothetical protein
MRSIKFKKLPPDGFMTYEELIADPTENDQVETKLLNLETLEKGDVFCHDCVIDHIPSTTSVITEVPSEIYVINEADFLTL